MSNLATANSFTWENDFDLQELDIEVSHFDQESRGYVGPDEDRMVKLSITDRNNGSGVFYEMGARDVETMIQSLTKLISR